MIEQIVTVNDFDPAIESQVRFSLKHFKKYVSLNCFVSESDWSITFEKESRLISELWICNTFWREKKLLHGSMTVNMIKNGCL